MTTKAVQDTKAADGAGPEMKSLEYHRQVLQSKMAQEGFVRQEREQQRHLRDGGQQDASQLTAPVLSSCAASCSKQQYISPSDNIMSPCTAKLTALRNKRVGK